MFKKKASLSIALLILILPMMAFFLFLFDTLRVSQAKQKIELTGNKALESALVEYDDEIYEKYRLMTLREEDEARAIFQKALEYTNSEKGARPPLASYTIDEIKLTLGGALADRTSLKTAILKKHEKYFIVSSLEKWMKKLDELKKVKPYAKACEAYSDAMKELFKLKKDYDKLGEIYKKIENLEAKTKHLNIEESIDKIHRMKRETEDLRKELRELQAELRGSNSIMHISANKNHENNHRDLASEIAGLEEEIEEKEREKNENKELIDSLLERNKELGSYYKKFRDFNTKLKEAGIKIDEKKEEIENISKEEDIEEARELIKNLVVKMNSALEELEKTKPQLQGDAGKAEEQNRDIRKALNREEEYEGDNSITDSSYADISNIESVTSLFGSWEKRGGEIEVNTIMDIIWLAMNGELLPDFSELNNPDFTKAPHLPSKDKDIVKKHTAEKFLERYAEPKPPTEEFGTKALEKTAQSSKDLADKELDFDIKNLFEKMVLADYITDTFSHYSFKEEDKSKFFSGAEVEYILSGSENTKHNLIMTQLKIFGLRYCLNFVPIALNKAEEIDKMSLFLSGFTGGLGYPIYKGLITLAWCSIETLADLKEINEGRGSVIIKSGNDIISSLSADDARLEQKELLDRELKKVKSKPGKDENEHESDGKLRMTYEEHLFLFLLIENEDDSLIRIADLIALKEKTDTRFLYTAIEADISYEIPRIFPGAGKHFNIKTQRNYNHMLKSISSY